MKKILINNNPWQTRIAITLDGQLQNIYFSAHATQNLERIFIKGHISKVLPGIQTAFVEIGQERAGFAKARGRAQASIQVGSLCPDLDSRVW